MNKASLIAAGMVFISFSCWLTAVPYFIYGPGLHLVHGELSGFKNGTNHQMCGAGNDEGCVAGKTSNTIWPAFVIIWMASFLNGVGYTAFYTLGYPYVDDNVSKKNAPLYFSECFSFLIAGLLLHSS